MPHNFLRNFSDRVQQYSIDEAFIDYTYMEEHFGAPMEAADKIREGIKKKFGLADSRGGFLHVRLEREHCCGSFK
jgi:DNA polymerase-4